MRRLPKPAATAAESYARSIEFAHSDLSDRLLEQTDEIVQSADDFDIAAAGHNLHLFPRQRDLGTVSNADMKSVYKKGFSAATAAGRGIYNSIRKLARNNKCPLCGVNQVTTLDHYLPQSRYADLVVCPNNLVPACSDCNRWKLANIPSTWGRQTFHPYYDDPNDARWLSATCVEDDIPVLEFSVTGPDDWDSARANHHFKVFKLASLYTSNAADELINIKGHLINLDESGGSAAVIEHLVEQEATYVRAQVNSWQGAMYRALAESDWFLQGGFVSIPD